MVQKNMLQTGDKIILIGFGGGMTSGAILAEWS
jgi:3-oxoacyl-[acyl-carrier-protein] synthase-3